MARVELASLALGVITDQYLNPLPGRAVTIRNPDGSNATTYTAYSGGSSSSTGTLTSNSDGTLPGWVEGADYLIGYTTPSGAVISRRLPAVSGSVESRVANVRSLQEFYTGTPPADMLATIHAGLEACKASGHLLYIPTVAELGFTPTVSGPITLSTEGGMCGAPHTFLENLPNLSAGHYSVIKLADSTNTPLIRHDYDNSAGKRGVERVTGGGQYWNHSVIKDLIFDGNGANQSSESDLISFRDMWGVRMIRCFAYRAKGTSYRLNNCNAVELLDVDAVGAAPNGPALLDQVYAARSHLVLENGTTECIIRTACGMHGCIGPNLLIDNAYYNRISGYFGYAVNDHGIVLKNNAAGNKLDVRFDKARKHCVHLESNARENVVDAVTMSAGYFNEPDGTDGPYAGFFDEGAGNQLRGSAPRAEAPGTAQAVTAVAATDLFTKTAHGYVAGDPVRFSALTGGAGITVDQTYYVIASGLTANDFKVSATLGGSTIDVTSDLTAGTVQKRIGSAQKHLVRFGSSCKEAVCSVVGRDLPSGSKKYLFDTDSSNQHGTISVLGLPPEIIIPAEQFEDIYAGTPSEGFAGTRQHTWDFDQTADEGIIATCSVPRGGAIKWTCEVYGTNRGAGSGNVQLQMLLTDYASGDTVASTAETTLTVTHTVGVSNLVVGTSFAGTVFDLQPGRIVRLMFARLGSNGNDTLANDWGLLWVKLVPQVLAP